MGKVAAYGENEDAREKRWRRRDGRGVGSRC